MLELPGWGTYGILGVIRKDACREIIYFSVLWGLLFWFPAIALNGFWASMCLGSVCERTVGAIPAEQ